MSSGLTSPYEVFLRRTPRRTRQSGNSTGILLLKISITATGADSWNFVIEISLRLSLISGAKVDILVHAAYIFIDAKQYGMAYEFACQLEPVSSRNQFKQMIALASPQL